MQNWHNQTVPQVIAAVSGDAKQGLASDEAARRLAKNGANLLQTQPPIAPWSLLFRQFGDVMVLLLLGAAIVSGILGERADALTIIAIITLNALLGFFQEYRAEKSLAALKELTAPQARVIRDGQIKIIPAKNLVFGDVMALESGDRIPGDGRLLEVIDLEADEATLTGESLTVSKGAGSLEASRPGIGEMKNMVFAGTVVTQGRGKAVVIAVGMDTEIGKIAGLIRTAVSETTPLQQRLDQLGRIMVLFCLGICAAVTTLGILRGEPPRQMFLAGVSLAVAAIPEGLPAIVTIALALGVQKMIRRHAIIRRLPAVETLGCATVICSDKTGTLTRNQLTVTSIYTAGGGLKTDGSGNDRDLSWDLRQLIHIAVLCNNAVPAKALSTPELWGDPTEQALLKAAENYGVSRTDLARRYVRLGENPFSAERKRMSVWIQESKDVMLLVKGAPDIIMERCEMVLTPKGPTRLSNRVKSEFQRKIDQWGADALRVLAFAYRPGSLGEIGQKGVDPENRLILVGLMGMADPPRPEIHKAVELSRRAGITTKMITGDYPATAVAIAKQIGLLRPGGKVITGAELERLSDSELARRIGEIDVFARVAPYHKLRVVKALKSRGEVVAMTGDGVNDAPAVKEADIGVAMGRGGTDVTKEAADMVIADDNYATIVQAVAEGRVIYANIRKSLRYLLSSNTGEILTMWGGLMLGLPLALLPIQILWVNLVTDGLPAIALGLEPGEPDGMRRPPRSPKEGIFAQGLGWKVAIQGGIIGLTTLAVFLIELGKSGLMTARTAAFVTLVFAQLGFAFQCRREGHSIHREKLQGNPYLTGAVLISGMMQLGVVQLPWMQRLFYTCALSLMDWLLIGFVLLGSIGISDALFRLPQRIRSCYGLFRIWTHRTGGEVGK